MTPVRSDELGVVLDRDADVPIGVQLAWALRARIRGGALAPGARLPALQRLAQDLGVNPNTVRAVYARLEQDGLVATRHGSGTFVCDAAGAGGDGPAGSLAQLVSGAARAARDAGFDPRELAAALYVGGEHAPARGGAAQAMPAGAQRNGAAAARRRLRDEVAALDRALADLLARRPDVAAQLPQPDDPSPTPQARLLSAAELEAQRDALLRRLIEAQTLVQTPPGDAPPPPDAAGAREPRRAPRSAEAKRPRRAPARPVAAKLRPAPRTT
jgi:DNA-binding transcriptional regulator YhcF (GntR family)